MQNAVQNRRGQLTERQKRFADYYLETGNARRSAELAGYSPGYAQAAKKQPAVSAYLRERLEKLDSARVASLEEVLEYLTQVLRGEDIEEGRRTEKAAAARMKAAEMLGKRLGLFAEHPDEQMSPAIIVDDVAGTGDEADGEGE